MHAADPVDAALGPQLDRSFEPLEHPAASTPHPRRQ